MVDTTALHGVVAEIYASVFNVPFARFRANAMDLVREIIPFDSAVWAAGIHETNQILDFELVDQDPSLIARYVAAYTETDLVRAYAIASPGQAFRIEDTMSLETYRALPVYVEFGQRLGIEHALGSASVDPATRLEQLAVLWRADRTRPFSDAERDAHALLVPHLFNAWRHRQATHVYEQARSGVDTQQLSQRYVGVVDGHGLIHAADSGFTAMLVEQFMGWQGPQLPGAILDFIRQESEAFTIGNIDFTWTPGEPRGIVVASRSARLVELTDAEWRVVRIFLEGKTAVETAALLGVSTSTVRNQIASAYAKLGVNSKIALARKINLPMDQFASSAG